MNIDAKKASYGLRCMCYGDVECNECPYSKDGSGWHDCRSNCAKDALDLLKNSVPQGVVDQIKWERDMLIQQLSEVGKGLGAKMDDVAHIVRCRDCIHYHKGFNCDLLQKPFLKDTNWFCADGEKRE